MKAISTLWKSMLLLFLLSSEAHAQIIGEYRSNAPKSGTPASRQWTNANAWLRWNGSTWAVPAEPPVADSQKVTILAGDSIIVSAPTSMDEVVVEAGAVLTLFNFSTPFTVTLNNGASGPDIEVNGRFYVSSGCTLTGTGSVQINTGGEGFCRFGSTLGVNLVNEGALYLNQLYVAGATITNNSTAEFISTTLYLNNNAQFINNDSLAFTNTGAHVSIEANAGSGQFINNGVLYKAFATPGTYVSVLSSVQFNNYGTIKGQGEFSILNTNNASNGVIAPGNSPGILTVNTLFSNAGTQNFQLEIESTGAVAGTNYDQVIFKSAPLVDLSNKTLTVTDNSNDAPGTVYTLFSTSSANINTATSFASVNLPPTLGNLTITSTAITVEKLSLLPLTWGYFYAYPKNGNINLDWETIQEIETSHFEIEYSTDNVNFVSIGTLPAKGNSDERSYYSFVHRDYSRNARVHYYRILQVDADQKHSSYSETRSVNLREDAQKLLVQVGPNPFTDYIRIFSSEKKIDVAIYDLNGRIVKKGSYGQGLHTISTSELQRGTYIVNVMNDDRKSIQKKFIKK